MFHKNEHWTETSVKYKAVHPFSYSLFKPSWYILHKYAHRRNKSLFVMNDSNASKINFVPSNTDFNFERLSSLTSLLQILEILPRNRHSSPRGPASTER